MDSSNETLRREHFGFDAPDALVAQQPMQQRDRAKMLVRRPDRSLRHCIVSDLTSELPSDSLLIFNDSRVIPGRLLGNIATGARVEVFLLRKVDGDEVWEALGRPLKKLKLTTEVTFAGGMTGHCVERLEDRVIMRFGAGFAPWLEENGFIPLPPYITRNDPVPASKSSDRDTYQTVYAKVAGSVAAPTAGLHFTPELMNNLEERGIEMASVCLHVGGGTFLPVKENDLDRHPMHSESYLIPQETLAKIEKAIAERRPIIAVGTTTLRSLESFHKMFPTPEAMRKNVDRWFDTDLFIRPQSKSDRYRPWAINALMTNFHQPYSTLIMLVAALLGYDETMAMYRTAVEKEYRLYSYGDSSLLWL